MDEIINELKKPYWWVTVVIAGLIINLIASFLFKSYEKYQAKKSEIKAEELKKKEEKKNSMIEALSGNHYGQNHYQFEVLEGYSSSNRVLIIGLILFIVPSSILAIFGSLGYFISIIFYFLGSLSIMQGFRIQAKAAEKREILSSAMKRQTEKREIEKSEP